MFMEEKNSPKDADWSSFKTRGGEYGLGLLSSRRRVTSKASPALSPRVLDYRQTQISLQNTCTSFLVIHSSSSGVTGLAGVVIQASLINPSPYWEESHVVPYNCLNKLALLVDSPCII
jgi:hypothetical protein